MARSRHTRAANCAHELPLTDDNSLPLEHQLSHATEINGRYPDVGLAVYSFSCLSPSPPERSARVINLAPREECDGDTCGYVCLFAVVDGQFHIGELTLLKN